MLEKTLESFLDCKKIQPVNLKGNQSWIFIGRTDAEAKAPVLWPPDAKNWLIGKDPDAGKDWRQNKRVTEDEMVEWHHWFNGHEFKQTPGGYEGQGSLAWCSPWGHRVRHDWVTHQQMAVRKKLCLGESRNFRLFHSLFSGLEHGLALCGNGSITVSWLNG